MSPQTILVLGGSGFVGRHLVARAVAADHRVVIPTRSRERAKHLILLPTVDVLEADIHDEVALARLVGRADVVVNLVGVLNESRDGDFDLAHVALARKVVAACRGTGVRRLLHMSALNADVGAPSRYLRSKGEAEAVVAGSGLAWTIVRPSVIFGREDSFLNLFATLQRLLPVVALGCAQARFQPVYVGDVASAFLASLGNDATHGECYSLCGPKTYTLRELVAYVGTLSGHPRPIIALGPALTNLQALVLEMLPGKLMSRDNVASMQRDSVCDCAYPALFAVAPTALEAIAPEYLAPTARNSRFDEFRAQSGR
jgi:uncharacterized protein YbjT (DUF2867 family)